MLVDGIEISYNSAGVLAHMVSDGDVAWISVSVSREHVMARIIEVCFFFLSKNEICLISFYEKLFFVVHQIIRFYVFISGFHLMNSSALFYYIFLLTFYLFLFFLFYCYFYEEIN